MRFGVSYKCLLTLVFFVFGATFVLWSLPFTAEKPSQPRPAPSIFVAILSDMKRYEDGWFFGVGHDPLTSRQNSLPVLGKALTDTWVTELRDVATVAFFVGGDCEDAEHRAVLPPTFPGTVVCLPTADTYPPQRKEFLMWEYLWRHHMDVPRWFFKVKFSCGLLCEG